MTCSCGERRDHIVGRRVTLDDIDVQFWASGDVTVGSALAPALVARRMAPGAFWLLAEEIGLYYRAELKDAARVARRAVRQDTVDPVVYFRRVMSGYRLQVVKGAHGVTVRWVANDTSATKKQQNSAAV